jgi:NAD(P)-dependent dehydrogenase (short-subunit alcohol dehydrogenase family)
MELKLRDKIVVLTGATGGIGRQICLDFLKEGAIVVCTVRKAREIPVNERMAC